MIETIKRVVPALLPGRPAVASVEPVFADRGHSVWKVLTQTGIAIAAKHQPFALLTRGAACDLLKVEQTVCGCLRAAGGPVPEVYGIHADLIFFEWCGDRTLDDACQESKADALSEYADRVVDAFLSIDAGFRTSAQWLSRRVFPGCGSEDLRASWQQATGRLSRSFWDLTACLNPAAAFRSKRAPRLLSDLIESFGQAPPALGPTDYNARNIVVAPGTGDLRFIEFSKLGWDWPERRLVQYATSLGAGRADGGFRSLIDRHAAVRYAGRASGLQGTASAEILRRLDGHGFIFFLLAGARLLAALSAPPEAPDARLLDAWQNPERRLKQIRQALAAPLSDDPQICELRSCFAPK